MVLTTHFVDGSVGRLEGDLEFILTAIRVTTKSWVVSMTIDGLSDD